MKKTTNTKTLLRKGGRAKEAAGRPAPRLRSLIKTASHQYVAAITGCSPRQYKSTKTCSGEGKTEEEEKRFSEPIGEKVRPCRQEEFPCDTPLANQTEEFEGSDRGEDRLETLKGLL